MDQLSVEASYLETQSYTVDIKLSFWHFKTRSIHTILKIFLA